MKKYHLVYLDVSGLTFKKTSTVSKGKYYITEIDFIERFFRLNVVALIPEDSIKIKKQ